MLKSTLLVDRHFSINGSKRVEPQLKKEVIAFICPSSCVHGQGDPPSEPHLQQSNSWGEVPNSSDEDQQAGITARRPRRGGRAEGGSGGVDSDGDDVAYLMEHNAWLLEQLEAKDGSCYGVVEGRREGGGWGRTYSLLALVVWTLTMHPFRNGPLGGWRGGVANER